MKTCIKKLAGSGNKTKITSDDMLEDTALLLIKNRKALKHFQKTKIALCETPIDCSLPNYYSGEAFPPRTRVTHTHPYLFICAPVCLITE